MKKTILCRCEDVTVEDFLDALDKGHRDLESLKRYTALGTGYCQGKCCLAVAADIFLEKTGSGPEGLLPTTPRPPLHPTPLKYFFQQEETP